MGFQQGLSGLNASARHLDTIGNNVANASTVGFKQSQAQFADMFAASLQGVGGVQIGTGTKIASVAQQFTQGNITSTTNPLDTAISGQGFFQLTDANNVSYYSRNGQFQIDQSGFLVNTQGHKVAGYAFDAKNQVIPQVGPLYINPKDMTQKETGVVTVGVNLDSRSTVPLTAVFNSADPTSYNNSTSLSIYDSAGASHVGTLYFQRQPIVLAQPLAAATTTSVTLPSTVGLSLGNTLTFAGATVPPVPVTVTITGINPATGVVSFAPVLTAPTGIVTTDAPSLDWKTYLTVTNSAGTAVPVTGAIIPPALVGTPELATLSFDTTGGLKTTIPIGVPAGSVVSDLLFPNSATVSTAQKLTLNFGTPVGLTPPLGAVQVATTQYGGVFGVNTLTQDGYTSGQLNATSTGTNGIITGRYSNGQSRPLGQIVLANFASPNGLQPVGNNEWATTTNSGAALINKPGAGGLGMLQSSATEDSNVDLTAELVNMITAQRTYQANAQTIKTQDQLLQTIVSLR